MYDLTNGALTPGQYHFQRNYDRTLTGPRVYDEQLPGLSDPDAAPRPPRWDELTSNQQATATRGLSEFGTNVDQIASDLGAQYDQGVKRAGDVGQEYAHAESFYSDRSTGPRQRVEQSAAELGIPHTVHAQMNAMTSPNTKFQATRGSTGEVYYPNDEAAKHAVAYVQQRGSSEGLTNEFDQTGMGEPGTRAQGYTNNIVKAAKSFEQHEQGLSPAEWVTGSKGSGPFDNSPKTGPYANSWSDSHPQFFVSTSGLRSLPSLVSFTTMVSRSVTRASVRRRWRRSHSHTPLSMRLLAVLWRSATSARCVISRLPSGVKNNYSVGWSVSRTYIVSLGTQLQTLTRVDCSDQLGSLCGPPITY
jgi:hypothetical protein